MTDLNIKGAAGVSFPDTPVKVPNCTQLVVTMDTPKLKQMGTPVPDMNYRERREGPSSPTATDISSVFDNPLGSPDPDVEPLYFNYNEDRIHNDLLEEICSDIGIKDPMDIDFFDFDQDNGDVDTQGILDEASSDQVIPFGQLPQSEQEFESSNSSPQQQPYKRIRSDNTDSMPQTQDVYVNGIPGSGQICTQDMNVSSYSSQGVTPYSVTVQFVQGQADFASPSSPMERTSHLGFRPEKAPESPHKRTQSVVKSTASPRSKSQTESVALPQSLKQTSAAEYACHSSPRQSPGASPAKSMGGLTPRKQLCPTGLNYPGSPAHSQQARIQAEYVSRVNNSPTFTDSPSTSPVTARDAAPLQGHANALHYRSASPLIQSSQASSVHIPSQASMSTPYSMTTSSAPQISHATSIQSMASGQNQQQWINTMSVSSRPTVSTTGPGNMHMPLDSSMPTSQTSYSQANAGIHGNSLTCTPQLNQTVPPQYKQQSVVSRSNAFSQSVVNRSHALSKSQLDLRMMNDPQIPVAARSRSSYAGSTDTAMNLGSVMGGQISNSPPNGLSRSQVDLRIVNGKFVPSSMRNDYSGSISDLSQSSGGDDDHQFLRPQTPPAHQRMYPQGNHPHQHRANLHQAAVSNSMGQRLHGRMSPYQQTINTGDTLPVDLSRKPEHNLVGQRLESPFDLGYSSSGSASIYSASQYGSNTSLNINSPNEMMPKYASTPWQLEGPAGYTPQNQKASATTNQALYVDTHSLGGSCHQKNCPPGSNVLQISQNRVPYSQHSHANSHQQSNVMYSQNRNANMHRVQGASHQYSQFQNMNYQQAVNMKGHLMPRPGMPNPHVSSMPKAQHYGLPSGQDVMIRPSVGNMMQKSVYPPDSVAMYKKAAKTPVPSQSHCYEASPDFRSNSPVTVIAPKQCQYPQQPAVGNIPQKYGRHGDINEVSLHPSRFQKAGQGPVPMTSAQFNPYTQMSANYQPATPVTGLKTELSGNLPGGIHGQLLDVKPPSSPGMGGNIPSPGGAARQYAKMGAGANMSKQVQNQSAIDIKSYMPSMPTMSGDNIKEQNTMTQILNQALVTKTEPCQPAPYLEGSAIVQNQSLANMNVQPIPKGHTDSSSTFMPIDPASLTLPKGQPGMTGTAIANKDQSQKILKQDTMSPAFMQNLIMDGSNAFKSHPLFPLLRDLIIADMNFNSPAFPFQLMANLPVDFDRLLQNFLHRNPPSGSYKNNQAVEGVIMDALKYAHRALTEKIQARKLEEDKKSGHLSVIDDFCERFDRAVRNSMQTTNKVNPSSEPERPRGPCSPVQLPHAYSPAGETGDSSASGHSTSSGETGSNMAGRNKVLPKEAVNVMMEWLKEHKDNPYPNDDEKEVMIRQTKLTINQINYWFTNARRRILPKWALQQYLQQGETNILPGHVAQHMKKMARSQAGGQSIAPDVLPHQNNY